MRWPISAIALFVLCGPALHQTARKVLPPPNPKLPFSAAVTAGDFVYLSGALATDEKGDFTGGDIRTQTKRVLENLSRVLKAAGSGLEKAVSVNVYLRNIPDFAAMNEVYQGFWPRDPPARTTIAAGLAVPEALIEISMVAVPGGRERKVVHPGGWIRSPNPYSYGIRSGDTLYLSGLLARRGRDNTFVAGGISVQTRTVLENAGEILREGGMTLADVAATRVYITDAASFQDMNAAYRAFFPKDPPARATVRAGLMSPDAVVEISLIAVQGGARQVITSPNADGSPAQSNPNLSPAIRVGNRLFLSGTLGTGQSTTVDGQTRVILDKTSRLLKLAGFGRQDLVEAAVYLTDMGNMDPMNAAYREFLQVQPPARATVGTGLMSPDGLVEIMFTAVR